MKLTIDQSLQQGIAAHKEGKIQDAERLYRVVLQSQPLHPDANHNLGVLAVSVNKADAALPLFKTALEANPKIEQFWLSYMDALIKTEKFDAAREALADAQQVGVTAAKLQIFEEKLQSELSFSSDKSQQELGNPLQSHQDELSPAIELREAGKHKEAQEWLSKFVQHNPANPEALSLLSQVLLLDKKEEEAERVLTEAASINSELPSVYRNQARLLLKQSKTAEALEKAQLGCKQSSEDSESLLVLAACLGANQRDLEALPLIEKILKAESNYAEAYANRALIKLRAKDTVGAIEDAEMTVSLKPHLTQMWQLLSSLHYQANNLSDAIEVLRRAHKTEPNNPDFMIQLGDFLRQDNKASEAITILEKATELFPKSVNAWTNLGVAFQQEGEIKDAKIAYDRALAINPNSAAILSNLGAMAKDAEDWEAALGHFGKALEIAPNLAEPHYNLGVTLQELSRLDEALASYNQAIALKPDYAEARHNLVELLTIYTSNNESSQPIVKVDQEIKKIDLKDKTFGVISNDKIIHLFDKSSNIIKNYDLDLGTELSQTYRRNSVDLDCKRHMKIFDKFNVIPKFCFGCYKVQVEPRSVLELIKLFVVFDQIKLSKNNTRKCMIEMRSEFPGFYKGLVYCSSVKEAYQIADYLETVVKEKIGSGLPLAVKRGCSEYPIVFPDYKEINKSGAQLMNYNEDWKVIEDDYDSKNSIKSKRIIPPSLSCLNLSDVLIIRNWIDYAKGIGDSSAQLLNQNGIVSQKFYKIAKTRLETHLWQESI